MEGNPVSIVFQPQSVAVMEGDVVIIHMLSDQSIQLIMSPPDFCEMRVAMIPPGVIMLAKLPNGELHYGTALERIEDEEFLSGIRELLKERFEVGLPEGTVEMPLPTLFRDKQGQEPSNTFITVGSDIIAEFYMVCVVPEDTKTLLRATPFPLDETEPFLIDPAFVAPPLEAMPRETPIETEIPEDKPTKSNPKKRKRKRS